METNIELLSGLLSFSDNRFICKYVFCIRLGELLTQTLWEKALILQSQEYIKIVQLFRIVFWICEGVISSSKCVFVFLVRCLDLIC